MGHQLLKTIHDSETGEPSRIKYDGDRVYVEFVILTTAGDDEPVTRTANLDCLGSYDFDEKDETAFLDLDEIQAATKVVENVPYIDRVVASFETDD